MRTKTAVRGVDIAIGATYGAFLGQTFGDVFRLSGNRTKVAFCFSSVFGGVAGDFINRHTAGLKSSRG